jgi:hypothetical protein
MVGWFGRIVVGFTIICAISFISPLTL